MPSVPADLSKHTKRTDFILWVLTSYYRYWLFTIGTDYLLLVLTLYYRYWLYTIGSDFVLRVLTLYYEYWLYTIGTDFILKELKPQNYILLQAFCKRPKTGHHLNTRFVCGFFSHGNHPILPENHMYGLYINRSRQYYYYDYDYDYYQELINC